MVSWTPSLLCQYTAGPCLALSTVHDEEITLSSYAILEDAIQAHLLPDNQHEPALRIRLRNDPHLLDCKRPGVKMHTILGVYEDLYSDSVNGDVNHDQTVPLRMTVHQAAVVNGEEECSACGSEAPHSDWERRPLQTSATTTSSASLSIRWVDLRTVADSLSSLDKSQAASCHFLRSLLGTSHAYSPWGAMSSRDDDNTMDALPSIVVLVLPDSLSSDSITTNVRVNDVCPSYFLQATARVRLPDDVAMQWWSQDYTVSSMQSSSSMSDATLVVFRTLPERENLSVRRPTEDDDEARTFTPDGCLWETYRRHGEEHDGGEEPVEDSDAQDEEEDISYRLTAPPYIAHAQDYPNLLEPLLRHVSAIREEALSIPQWTAWPEQQHYRSLKADGDEDEQQQTNSTYPASWTVFPLCHCFPSNQVSNRSWIRATTSFVPKTTALLKELLGDTLRTALFSRLDAETVLEAHTGWQDLANHVYRVHIPLVVPEGGLCGTWVDGCVETHVTGRPLVFDDSKVHRAFNYSSSERVVLILDLARPGSLPKGTATGGHTEELDKFIQQLT